MREWRNRQTRTFEGRVVIPYGFKSRLSHQEKHFLGSAFQFYSQLKIIPPMTLQFYYECHSGIFYLTIETD